jgi:hypothetical protein
MYVKKTEIKTLATIEGKYEDTIWYFYYLTV